MSAGLPTAVMRPLSMTAARSAIGSTVRANCSATRTEMPSSTRLGHGLVHLATIMGASPIDSSSRSSTAGSDGQGPGQREHLLLAAGHRAGELVAAVAEDREARERRLLDLRRAATPVPVASQRFSRTVRLAKTPRPSGIVQTPRRGGLLGADPRHRATGVAHVAGGRRQQPGGDLERRRLAAAVGSEQRDDLPGPTREVDAVQHLDRAVGRAHAHQLEDRRRRGSSELVVDGQLGDAHAVTSAPM